MISERAINEMNTESIMNTERDQLKIFVRGAYDIQKQRIQTGNRIAANFKAKLGQAPSQKEEDGIDAEGQKILKNLRLSYRRLTDGIVGFPRQAGFKGDEIISSYTELCLVSQYIDQEESETKHFRNLEKMLREFPIYRDFLVNIHGVGPAMAGVIISEIDITQAQYPSSLWKYAGLDVANDGRGRSRKKEHLTEVTYISKDGEEKTRVGITFNPFLKTKLVGVLGASFIKQSAAKCEYRRIYDDYKHRLESNPAHQEKTKLHRHNMAVRYMVKRFLADLYAHWRTLEGLPVATEYAEGKLGIKHRAA